MKDVQTLYQSTLYTMLMFGALNFDVKHVSAQTAVFWGENEIFLLKMKLKRMNIWQRVVRSI